MEGMISHHVDDFMLAGIGEFVTNITEKVTSKLDILKIKDGVFRFTGIDIKKDKEKIKVSKNDYAKCLEIIEVRNGNPY